MALVKGNSYALKVCLCLCHCLTMLNKRKGSPFWKTFSVTLHCLHSWFYFHLLPQMLFKKHFSWCSSNGRLSAPWMWILWCFISEQNCIASVMVCHWEGDRFFRTPAYLGTHQKRRGQALWALGLIWASVVCKKQPRVLASLLLGWLKQELAIPRTLHLSVIISVS